MDKLQIRLADAEDITAIVACVRRAYAKYIERIGREPAPMNADYVDLVQQQQVHVLANDAQIYGCIVLIPQADHLLLDNIAVAPQYQGYRFGNRLLSFAETQAQQHGYHAIRLYTNERMTENIDYYQRKGYMETKRMTESGFNRVYMQKTLV